MKKTILIILSVLGAVLVLFIIVAIIGFIRFNFTKSGNILPIKEIITNFEECAAAGNPVMESYPRRCRADKETFTETIAPTESEKIKIKVFFNNNKLDPEITCHKVFPVEREVVKTPAIARAALTELLAGTTKAENEAGYITIINPNVKIQSLSIEDGVAKADFNEQLQAQVGGSCKVAAIRAQISETLKQFPSVKEVIISIDGRWEDILQP